ncbi:3'-5' exonuclease domain [Macleaya cordata]|uniref:3'-5' exonuclease domain n=1 Tax=Macleaya cordata TaxID=56857 RepID=A0A200R1Z1_MACCD|nr:3'-5' exonuclease domain [Macleaya cordata]
MSIYIEELNCSSYTHHSYNVTFYDDQIKTVVTQTASIVDQWIFNIYHDFRRKLNNLVVGLDVEWRANFHGNIQYKVAVLQLCVAHRCLIFQFLHADYIPRSLFEFLNNPNFTFVGVGINADADKLLSDYGLKVAKTVDLRPLAAKKLKMKELNRGGLKSLARTVLGQELPKPKRVTLSRWDAAYLKPRQIQYACLDAFVSFKIGRDLMS